MKASSFLGLIAGAIAALAGTADAALLRRMEDVQQELQGSPDLDLNNTSNPAVAELRRDLAQVANLTANATAEPVVQFVHAVENLEPKEAAAVSFSKHHPHKGGKHTPAPTSADTPGPEATTIGTGFCAVLDTSKIQGGSQTLTVPGCGTITLYADHADLVLDNGVTETRSYPQGAQLNLQNMPYSYGGQTGAYYYLTYPDPMHSGNNIRVVDVPLLDPNILVPSNLIASGSIQSCAATPPSGRRFLV